MINPEVSLLTAATSTGKTFLRDVLMPNLHKRSTSKTCVSCTFLPLQNLKICRTFWQALGLPMGPWCSRSGIAARFCDSSNTLYAHCVTG